MKKYLFIMVGLICLLPSNSHAGGGRAGDSRAGEIDLQKLKAEIKAELKKEMTTQLRREIKAEILAEMKKDPKKEVKAPPAEKGGPGSLPTAETVVVKPEIRTKPEIRFSGQVRLRPEVRRNLTQSIPNVPANLEEDVSVLLRSRFGVLFKPASHISFFVQAEDSRDFGEEAAATPLAAGDDEGLDLHQGYIDITDIGEKPLLIRAGRQEISLGEQRLVGAVDWSNVGRSLDGILISYQPEKWGLTGLAAVTNKTPANAGDGQYFGGVYGTWKKFPGGVLDGYYLVLEDNNGATGATGATSAAAGTGDTLSVHTVGMRIASKFKSGIDLGFEGAAQFGKFGSNGILAFAGHGAVGYTFNAGDSRAGWKPRLGLEYNYATGDNPATSRYTKFNNLLSTNHNKYGMMDLTPWSNIHDAVFRFGVKPGKFQAEAAYHMLAVDKNTSAGDTFAGFYAGAPGLGKIAGHEIDVQGKWVANEYFELGAGVGHFIPGSFLKGQGITRHSDFFYVTAQARF